jgi:integrase
VTGLVRSNSTERRHSSSASAASASSKARQRARIPSAHDEPAASSQAAGLPVIKLHEGRHSTASEARDADVDPEIRVKTLGHADQAMTTHYTYIAAQAHRTAAEAVARLMEREP